MLWEYLMSSDVGASGADQWLVGGDDEVAGSPNGIVYEHRATIAGTTFINCMAYGAGRWVAGMHYSGERIATSIDGAEWEATGFALQSGEQLNALIFANNLFVGGTSNGRIITSPDGLTWTVRTSNFPAGRIMAIAYGGGKFMAVGGANSVIISTNGTTWTAKANSLTSTTLSAVIYGAAGLWIIGGASGFVATSLNDGTSWTARVSNAGASQQIFDFAAGAGLIVGVTAYGSAGGIITSANGTTWAAQSVPSSGIPYRVRFGGGLFVLGGKTAANHGYLATSTTGLSWSSQTVPAEIDLIYGLAYSG